MSYLWNGIWRSLQCYTLIQTKACVRYTPKDSYEAVRLVSLGVGI